MSNIPQEYKLTKEEMTAINDAMSETAKYGEVFLEIRKAQARHILERLNEECKEHHHFYSWYDPNHVFLRHDCPECMAEYEKELIGEK